MSTYFPKPGEIVRKWFVVDADGQTLGRMASQVARILMGKENPQYAPFLDTGDHVIVINAEKIKTTGMKSEQKQYHHYTGYPGGLRTEDYRKRLARKPEKIIEDAVRRMTSLPAHTFSLHDRGLIREGMAADLVVFDPARVEDKATYIKPHQYAQGFDFVLVNGQLVVDDGKLTPARPGQTLRHKQ